MGEGATIREFAGSRSLDIPIRELLVLGACGKPNVYAHFASEKLSSDVRLSGKSLSTLICVQGLKLLALRTQGRGSLVVRLRPRAVEA